MNCMAWAEIIHSLKLILAKPTIDYRPKCLCSFVISLPNFLHMLRCPKFPICKTPHLNAEKDDLLLHYFMHYLIKQFENKIYMRNWVPASILLPLSFLFYSWFFLFFSSFVFNNLFQHFETGEHFSVGCYGRRPQKHHISRIQNTLIYGWNANPHNGIIIVYLHWNCTHGFVIMLINLDPNEAKLFCIAAELIYVI